MNLARKILSTFLSLVMVCGAFAVLPTAAEETSAFEPKDGTYAPNEVVVLFKDGSIKESVPSKSELAATGAHFGDVMGAVSSEDAALSAVKDEAQILADSLGDDFTLEDTLVFSDSAEENNGPASTGATGDAPAEEGLTVALVSSDKYDTETMIEKLSRNRKIAAVEPNQFIRLTDHADYSLNDTYNSYLYNLNSPAALNTAGNSVEARGVDPVSALSLNASDAWKKLSGSEEEIVIAVVDTGVLGSHEDLRDKMWINPGNIGLEGVTHPTVTVSGDKLYYMLGASLDQSKQGEDRLMNDVYRFDGTTWEKVGTIPFIGRYDFDNVAIYHMESTAKVKNGIVFVNTSVDGSGNVFLFNTETNACEPLYYTTDDTITDCYNTESSCVATKNGIYYVRKTGQADDEGYALYLLPADSGAYDSLYDNAILGDADGDGEVTILDATAIQQKLSDIKTKAFNEKAADTDGDGEVTILDATYIQRWLAGLSCPEGIGKPTK